MYKIKLCDNILKIEVRKVAKVAKLQFSRWQQQNQLLFASTLRRTTPGTVKNTDRH